MGRKTTSKNKSLKKTEALGLSLEVVVSRIQQMMDESSSVTHNELLEDRVGNKRQYDVVIRGKFGGKPVLGVIECKDHSRKKGPDAIEAFAKKTENLGANLRLMVSRKGYTKKALKLAKHEYIGCLSLLPEDPGQAGFSIGDMWYGVIQKWTNVRLMIHFALDPSPIATFNANNLKWNGKPVVNWFLRELFTTYGAEKTEGEFTFELKFDQQRNIEIEDQEYPVVGITCLATRVHKKKRKWVHWSGDAFLDWHTSQLSIPPKGTVVGSAVETDLREWEDYKGEIPELGEQAKTGIIQAVLYDTQKWDSEKDEDVPDLKSL